MLSKITRPERSEHTMAEYKHPYLGRGPGCESAEWKKCSSKLAMICKCQRPDWTKKGRRSEWRRETKRWNLIIIMHLYHKSSFYIKTLHVKIWKTDLWAIYYARLEHHWGWEERGNNDGIVPIFSEKTKQFILQQSQSWYQHTMIKIW